MAAATAAWVQVARPDFVLLPIYVDDSLWHSSQDAVTATIGIQNQGSGPARRVTLEKTFEGEWRQTSSSDQWAIVAPGESVQLLEGGLVLDDTRNEAAKYMSGVAGLADFRGMKVRVHWRNNLGIPRTRT
ncbi:hypothetical protein ADILRU_1285 [Leifsonia rubra CMS 76R]|nr:hypothetical protein ADILRU_1285 [Leifsonia rubra CMS 76R]